MADNLDFANDHTHWNNKIQNLNPLKLLFHYIDTNTIAVSLNIILEGYEE